MGVPGIFDPQPYGEVGQKPNLEYVSSGCVFLKEILSTISFGVSLVVVFGLVEIFGVVLLFLLGVILSGLPFCDFGGP